MSDDKGHLPSTCWWLPHERLIAADGHSVAPASKLADVYVMTLTIAQV
jgi:hypothetical protein